MKKQNILIKLKAEDKSALFENIIENNWNAIVFANMEGIVEFANEAAYRLYGYEKNELEGVNVDIFNSHLTHNTQDIVDQLISQGHWHGELIQRKKDDSTFNALLHVQIIPDKNGNPIGYASNSKDITLDKESAQQLKKIIGEKEVLIKEIHHRVKNNMATIQGMLKLQHIMNKGITMEDFLLDFQSRLHVLAEAHNNLGGETSLQEINLGKYLQTIASDVTKLFAFNDKKIEIRLDVKSFLVPIDIAIPTGLITNEVITNSFKHAFSDHGVLHICLSMIDDVIELKIEDNGPGFDNQDMDQEDSLGLSLIDGLASQLEAEYSFEHNNGTLFRMKYRLNSNQ